LLQKYQSEYCSISERDNLSRSWSKLDIQDHIARSAPEGRKEKIEIEADVSAESGEQERTVTRAVIPGTGRCV
jgi:hypothetical protein